MKGKLYGDIEETFEIDTGCSSAGDLRSELFETIVKQASLKTSQGLSEIMVGTISASLARIPEVSLGGFKCNDLIFSKSTESRLGMGLFSRFLVTFDFPRGRIYLQKGKDFDKPDKGNRTGLHSLLVDEQVVVHSVVPNSPAANAGVLPKDLICETNGEHVTSDQFRRGLFSNLKDNEKVTFTIRRGAQDKIIAFKLKRQI